MGWFQGSQWGGSKTQGWFKSIAAVAATTWSSANKAADWSLSTDKLTATHSGTSFSEVRATASKASGASFSVVKQSSNGDFLYAGINLSTASLGDLSQSVLVDMRTGVININGSADGSKTVGAIAINDVVLFDFLSNGTQLAISVNGTLKGTYSVVAGTYTPCSLSNNEHVIVGNFSPSGKPAWA